MMGLDKRWLIGGVVALVLGGGYWYKSHDDQPIHNRYKTVKITKETISQTVSANGTLNPVVLVSVGTQVSGSVKELKVDYNAYVHKGDVLAVLDPALLDAQVRQSQANVESAQATYELALSDEKRARLLVAKEYISKQEMDQATKTLKTAYAALQAAKATLSKDQTNQRYTVIRSPVSGVVIDRQIDLGQTVAASFQTPTLFKIAQDLRKMQIDANFAEADIGLIRVGQKVTFTVDAFANESFVGVVKQIRLNATTTSNVVTYDVVVSVDNPEEKLKPGMTAYVTICVDEKTQVLAIANAALRYKPNTQSKDTKKPKEGSVVYRLQGDRVIPVSIKTGITDSKKSHIISGDLHEGDEVIIEETTQGNGQSKGSQPMRMF